MITGVQQTPFIEAIDGFRAYLDRHLDKISYQVLPLRSRQTDLPDMLYRLQRMQPDLLFVLGSEALDAVSHLEEEIPLIAGMVLEKKTITAHPGVTGVYLEFPPETHFKWLRRILPKAETVGVLYNRSENRQRVAEAEEIAEKLGLTLVSRPVDEARDLPSALNDLGRKVEVFWGISDDVVLTPQTARHLLLFSFRQRIPFIGLSFAWAKAGALYALDRDYRDVGRQCAEIALDVLKGKPISEIPPRPPREVIYAINLKTARQMKIDLPPPIIEGAAEVF